MNCGVGHRGGSDPALLWLWHRPAAIALIRPLAWELPQALKRQDKKKERKKEMTPNATEAHVVDTTLSLQRLN